MKKVFTVFLISAMSISAYAKKVKFMVDMDTITPNVNGIHITGNFQVAAGFAADWDPAITPMTQEASDPSLYSIVVDIPAFKKYEFKIVNGIFGYEVEFVPEKSRVGYQFNDNRWIYIDSLANDTQVVAPVIYAANAPAKKHMLRFRVDMRNVAGIDPKGVHVAGSFQSWDPAKLFLYSFDGFIYEYIAYVDTGMPNLEHEFKYYNGNTAGVSEVVPIACANANTNRGVKATSDSVLIAVCYSSCAACAGNGISEIDEQLISVYPNPSRGEVKVQSQHANLDILRLYNVLGKVIADKKPNATSGDISIFHPGVYFLMIEAGGKVYSEKIVVE